MRIEYLYRKMMYDVCVKRNGYNLSNLNFISGMK